MRLEEYLAIEFTENCRLPGGSAFSFSLQIALRTFQKGEVWKLNKRGQAIQIFWVEQGLPKRRKPWEALICSSGSLLLHHTKGKWRYR